VNSARRTSPQAGDSARCSYMRDEGTSRFEIAAEGRDLHSGQAPIVVSVVRDVTGNRLPPPLTRWV